MFGCMPCPLCRKYPSIYVKEELTFRSFGDEGATVKEYRLKHVCSYNYDYSTASLSKETVKDRWNAMVRELEEDEKA